MSSIGAKAVIVSISIRKRRQELSFHSTKETCRLVKVNEFGRIQETRLCVSFHIGSESRGA